MARFSSCGHTVFREGDPAIPDIEAEKRGVPPSAPKSGRYGTGSTEKTRSKASRRLRSKASRRLRSKASRRLRSKGSEIAGRALRAFARRDSDRSEGRGYELDGALAARLREEADRRGVTEREVMEEAVRLYLARCREEAVCEITEEEWLRVASSSPAFAFLDDPEEDVYGPEDGDPWEGP